MGTKDKPFLESSANCEFCLDLNKYNLSRQWRQFGDLPPIDGRYHITLQSLAANLERTNCPGCALIHQATEHIIDQNGRAIHFQNLTLEYLSPSTRGSVGLLSTLSLKLSSFLPAKDKDAAIWHMINDMPDLDVQTFTRPTPKSPDREREYRVSTPRYEIFVPEKNAKQETLEKSTEESSPKDTLWDAIVPARSRCGASPTSDLLAHIRSCLDLCRSAHPLCQVEDDSQWSLPTRVIDVGSGNETDNEYAADPTLYTPSPGEQQPYLCLSHCWGTSDKNTAKPLQTRKATLSKFQQPHGIDWSRLTKTFQEAIIFTRKLGVRYLWIDSLCIIQDDADDWAREAAKMASIYENSTLTLAAAASANSHAGLFRESGPTFQLDVPKNAKDNFGICKTMNLRQLPNPSFFDYKSYGKDAKHVSPLLKRAWVYQERILSRRVLFFTPLEAVFECRSGTETDSNHDWVDSKMKHRFARTVYAKSKSEKEVPDLSKRRGMISDIWRHLVVEFTHLGLTMQKDTLPAIAGIAKRVQVALGEKNSSSYLAGLWRQTMVQDLLWEVDQRVETASPRVNRGVPTWSWARTDAPKKYPTSNQIVQFCDFVDGSVQPATTAHESGDPFVGVTAGHIILSGHLIPARTEGTRIYVKHNPRAEQLVIRDYDWNEPGNDQINDGDELFALPLVTQPNPSGAVDDSVNVVCAVLRPVPGAQGTFSRSGLFSASTQHLAGHEYIFEGSEVLRKSLRSSINFGESLLEKYTTYEESKEDDEDLSGTSDREAHRWVSKRTLLAGGALYVYWCLFGGKEDATMSFKEFCGRPHLEFMRDSLSKEEDRLEEWRKRSRASEQQVKERTTIKLV